MLRDQTQALQALQLNPFNTCFICNVQSTQVKNQIQRLLLGFTPKHVSFSCYVLKFSEKYQIQKHVVIS